MGISEKRDAAIVKITKLRAVLKHGKISNEIRVTFNAELKRLEDFISFTNANSNLGSGS